MQLKAAEVMAAAGQDGLAPLMDVAGLRFDTSLKLAQVARKLGEEAETIMGRVKSLRTKHGADEAVDEVLEKHEVKPRTPEEEWPPECTRDVQFALKEYIAEVDVLMGTEIEVLVDPVSIPKDTEGVTPAMLIRVVKFVKAE
jgi:hypothetical protein